MSSENLVLELKHTGTINAPTMLDDSSLNTLCISSMKRKEPDASDNTNSTIVSGMLEGVRKGIPLDANREMSPEKKIAISVSLDTAEGVRLDRIRDNVTTSPEGLPSNKQDKRNAGITISVIDKVNSNVTSASSNPEINPSKETNQPEGKYFYNINVNSLLQNIITKV